MPYYHARNATFWPREDEPGSVSYCDYCRRQHRSDATACDGCGAPKTRRATVFDQLIDITTHAREPHRHPDRVLR